MQKIILRKLNVFKVFMIYLLFLLSWMALNLYLNNSQVPCLLIMKNVKMFEDFGKLNKFEFPLCNKRSRRHGYHQKVIGVSAYQSNRDNILLTNKILSYTLQYINESKYFYPNWRVRVYYHNFPMKIEQILQIEKEYPNVDFCNSSDIPLLGDITSFISGRLHRFIAIADPFVDVFMSRDIDSPILEREVTSVNEWLLSQKLFHVMRDHPFHSDVILAGLWGVKVYQNETIRKKLAQPLLSKSLVNCYNPVDGDLRFLEHYLWPLAKQNSIQHDSFYCQKYHSSIPFTQPKLSTSKFIGCRRPCRSDQDPPGLCPVECLYSNQTNRVLC